MCSICNGGSATSHLDDDAQSATSGKSSRSNTSRRSTRTTNTITRTTREVSGKATTSGRYGALPFDSDGYCCRHPSVQIAQRKLMGGFKIIHGVCPDCVRDDERRGSNGSGNNASSRSRGTRSRSKSRDDIRSHSLSQQRRRSDECCIPRQPKDSTVRRRASVSSEVASFKQKLYSEFRM